ATRSGRARAGRNDGARLPGGRAAPAATDRTQGRDVGRRSDGRAHEAALADEAARAAQLPPLVSRCGAGWRLLAHGPHLALASAGEVGASHDGGATFGRVVTARRAVTDVQLTSTGTVVAEVDGRHRAVLASGEVVAIGPPPREATRRRATLQARGDWLVWAG